MMKRIVVTGATSMVGIALINQCIQNNVEVIALGRKNSPKNRNIPKHSLVSFYDYELEKLDEVKIDFGQIDVFYHLAWAHTNKDERNDVKKQYLNIEYSIKALELAHTLGCKRFIGTGSQAEYGVHYEEVTGPDTICNPMDAYGIAKYTAGRLCGIEAEKLGMEFCWVRIFSLYGPHDKNNTLISNLMENMVDNKPCKLTKANHKWDFLYEKDAGNALFLLGTAPIVSDYYCLGSGDKATLKEYILELKETLNSDSELVFGAIPYDGQSAKGFTSDCSKLMKDTVWRPQYSFKEGILDYLNEIS